MHIHTHTYTFSDSFPLQVITRHWVACPVWRSRLLFLFPYFIHSDVYMGSWLFETPYTVAHQAPLSIGILQAGILEWVAMPSSRGFSQPRIAPRSPELQADSLLSESPGKPNSNNGTHWRYLTHFVKSDSWTCLQEFDFVDQGCFPEFVLTIW